MENILVHFERNDLISLIKERFSIDEVRMDDTFKYDLLLDSLDVVELVCDVECKIGEVIPENVVDSFETPGDVWRYVQTRQKELLG